MGLLARRVVFKYLLGQGDKNFEREKCPESHNEVLPKE
jgi:hypothetical protein